MANVEAENVKAEEKAPVIAREAELKGKYNVRHKSHGKWIMDGDETLYANKVEAFRAAAMREAEENLEDELGDVRPAGYEHYSITTTRLVRNSAMELPMNEKYTADGQINPHYDRQWIYAWAYKDRADLARQRASGYIPVDPKEFRKDVKDGTIPDFVGDLVYEEGSFMAYGDTVLVRKPRFLWRQQRDEIERRARRHMTDQHSGDVNAGHRMDSRAASVLSGADADRLGLVNSLELLEV